MSTRVTDKDLYRLVERLNSIVKEHEYHIDIAYGQPRLARMIPDSDCAVAWESPRLPRPQLHEWIYAFMKGYGLGKDSC